jgi:UDP-N-acetylmuramoyl-L-alanyl-D-glutamate--2,6-diaminopimelate ligase
MKRLRELLAGIDILGVIGDIDTAVTGIACHSQKVEKGFCYVAIKGAQADGIHYLVDAITRGAAAVVSVHPPEDTLPHIVWVQVKNDRRILSQLAARFWDNPSQKMNVIGITGTNGKTTTAVLIQALLQRDALAGVIGTLGMQAGAIREKTVLTTPEAPELFTFMAYALQQGCRHLAMEVSSAALSMGRVDDISFAQAVFTSFSGDHLDFHQTMENYFAAKLSLFKRLPRQAWAIINIDDARGLDIIHAIECKYLTYGTSLNADIRPLKFRLAAGGCSGTLQTPKDKIDFTSPLVGRFNLYNIMAATGSALVAGLAPTEISAGLAAFTGVRGRMQTVHRGEFTVLVDFAHTDQALENLLTTLQEVTTGRIILVFGAGGSRDRTKRPRMGQAASEHAGYVIVTSDNPRQEDPEAIIREIVAGFVPGFDRFQVEPDRRRAIELAIGLARSGDVVAIAGKGHEDYQIFKDRTIHFDDAEVVQEIIGGRHA